MKSTLPILLLASTGHSAVLPRQQTPPTAECLNRTNPPETCNSVPPNQSPPEWIRATPYHRPMIPSPAKANETSDNIIAETVGAVVGSVIDWLADMDEVISREELVAVRQMRKSKGSATIVNRKQLQDFMRGRHQDTHNHSNPADIIVIGPKDLHKYIRGYKSSENFLAHDEVIVMHRKLLDDYERNPELHSHVARSIMNHGAVVDYNKPTNITRKMPPPPPATIKSLLRCIKPHVKIHAKLINKERPKRSTEPTSPTSTVPATKHPKLSLYPYFLHWNGTSKTVTADKPGTKISPEVMKKIIDCMGPHAWYFKNSTIKFPPAKSSNTDTKSAKKPAPPAGGNSSNTLSRRGAPKLSAEQIAAEIKTTEATTQGERKKKAEERKEKADKELAKQEIKFKEEMKKTEEKMKKTEEKKAEKKKVGEKSLESTTTHARRSDFTPSAEQIAANIKTTEAKTKAERKKEAEWRKKAVGKVLAKQKMYLEAKRKKAEEKKKKAEEKKAEEKRAEEKRAEEKKAEEKKAEEKKAEENKVEEKPLESTTTHARRSDSKLGDENKVEATSSISPNAAPTHYRLMPNHYVGDEVYNDSQIVD